MNEAFRQGTLTSRVAIATLLILPLTVILYRHNVLEFQPVLALLALSFFGSLAIFFCCGIALINRKKQCPFNANMKKTLLISAAVPLTLILFIGHSHFVTNYPIIHDITTDAQEVPKFHAAVILRGSDSNSLAVKPKVIAQQIAAYPNIKTIKTDMGFPTAFSMALSTAEGLGWVVHHVDVESGKIEAYQKTKIWHFVDDIVIRVRATNDITHIDLRSVSRIGSGDLGANAKRIEQFTAMFVQQQ